MDSRELDKAGFLEPSAGRCYQEAHDFHIWPKTTCIWFVQIPDTWADISALASLTMGDARDPEQPHIRRSTEKVSRGGGNFPETELPVRKATCLQLRPRKMCRLLALVHGAASMPL